MLLPDRDYGGDPGRDRQRADDRDSRDRESASATLSRNPLGLWILLRDSVNRRCEIRDGRPESPVAKIQLRLVWGRHRRSSQRGSAVSAGQEWWRETGRPFTVDPPVLLELEVTVGDHEEEALEAVAREPRLDLARDPFRGRGVR